MCTRNPRDLHLLDSGPGKQRESRAGRKLEERSADSFGTTRIRHFQGSGYNDGNAFRMSARLCRLLPEEGIRVPDGTGYRPGRHLSRHLPPRSSRERKFVYRTTNLRRLRTPRDAPCGFLRDDGCSIHPAKPTQCRIFPFWPELVEDKAEWHKTADWCPEHRQRRADSDRNRSKPGAGNAGSLSDTVPVMLGFRNFNRAAHLRNQDRAVWSVFRKSISILVVF